MPASSLMRAAVVVLLLAAAARAAEPASQPDPGKLVVKLVAASTTPMAGLPSEDWIAKEAGATTVDLSEWIDCGPAATALNTRRLPRWDMSIKARRDTTSGLFAVDLTGAKTKSFMLVGRLGQQQVERLDRLSDGRTVLLAMWVAPATFKPIQAFGTEVQGVRLSLGVTPTDWSGKMTAKLVVLMENVGSDSARRPHWAQHVTPGLEVTRVAGGVIPPQTVAPDRMPFRFSGVDVMPLGEIRRMSGTIDIADMKIVMASSSGVQWTWHLEPGEYDIRAVGDYSDGVRTGLPAQTPVPVYSQRVRIRLTDPPASQPAR